MKSTKSISFALLVGLSGASGESLRTDINPALLYNQALLVAPQSLSEADDAYLGSKEGLSQKLPERFGKIVAGYDNEFKLVRQAALATVPCDWGIDLSQGPSTLLPHLARTKSVVVAARLRVRWELEHGRQADARDDLLAAFTLGRNVARDGTLISALVQIAIENISCCVLAENFGKFSPEILKQLADGFDAATPRTTIAASVLIEKVSFHDWLVSKILDLQKQNPSNDAKVMEGIGQLLANIGEAERDETSQPPPPSLWEQLTHAGATTSEAVLKLLREEGELYQRVASIAALPPTEFETQIKEFNAELEKSSNPFVSVAFPAVEKAKKRELKMQVWLAMVRAAVEYKLHGEPAFQSVADPCGKGPFNFQRFMYEGVDRGFELRSAYQGSGFPEAIIFVEHDGPPFMFQGPYIGEPRGLSVPQK
jgi:hypothetical protein